MHTVVDRNNGKVSTPRFTVMIVQASNNPAGKEMHLSEQQMADMSQSRIDRSSADLKVSIGDPISPLIAKKEPEQPLAESIPVNDVPLGVIKEESDPKMKADKILQSVFGNDAEEGESLEGSQIIDAEAHSEVIDEGYSEVFDEDSKG